MRIVVVGGSGHVGTFLVPRLVQAGHEVVNLSRGRREAYVEDGAWQQVEQVVVDREAEDRAGNFGDRVLEQRPDAVVDLICFTLDSATALVDRLRGEVAQLVHCGSIWRYGPSRTLPVTEQTATPPVGEYGIQKDAIARMLREETRSGGLVTTSLHPGHISGPGWAPIGPLGNLDAAVWRTLSAGEELVVPGTGAELMHHVHADDVAQLFQLALEQRDAAAGEAFDAVAPSALTVRGYAEAAASWFGQQARLRATSWEEFRAATPAEHAGASWEHLWRSHFVSIDKPRAVLGYAPRHEPDATALEAVRWLVEHDRLEVAGPLVV